MDDGMQGRFSADDTGWIYDNYNVTSINQRWALKYFVKKLYFSSFADICRVCRSEGSPDRPLFYPCVCTGSIKYIHQDCLVQWLRYSRKEYCELCNHRFSFTPSKYN